MSGELVLNKELVKNEIKVRYTINKALTKIKILKEIVDTKPDPEKLERVKRKIEKFSQILGTAKKVHYLSALVAARIKSKPSQKGKLKEPSKRLKKLKTGFKNGTEKSFNPKKQKPTVIKTLQPSTKTKTMENVTAPEAENLDEIKVVRKRKVITSEEEKIKILPKSISQLENEEAAEVDDDAGGRGTFRGRGALGERGAFHGRGALSGRGAPRGRVSSHERGAPRGRAAPRPRGRNAN